MRFPRGGGSEWLILVQLTTALTAGEEQVLPWSSLQMGPRFQPLLTAARERLGATGPQGSCGA